ncbi:MAG: hypothetical protein ACTFAL_10830 [Candidatus Electronema sp. V4]|uniref:hypothetical protein n=1 Tax=Candidatus Electronema sp. V4 TaxID=3454756 RepID=UPI0040558EFB
MPQDLSGRMLRWIYFKPEGLWTESLQPDDCIRNSCGRMLRWIYFKPEGLWTESLQPDDCIRNSCGRSSISKINILGVNTFYDFFSIPSGSVACDDKAYVPLMLKTSLNGQASLSILLGKIKKENMSHSRNMKLNSSRNASNPHSA